MSSVRGRNKCSTSRSKKKKIQVHQLFLSALLLFCPNVIQIQTFTQKLTSNLNQTQTQILPLKKRKLKLKFFVFVLCSLT